MDDKDYSSANSSTSSSSDVETEFIFDEEDVIGAEASNDVDDRAILPYMFEPELSGDEGSDAEADMESAEDRLLEIDVTNLENWCTCQNCQVLPTRKECVCCAKIGEFRNMMEGLQCFTMHQDFHSACLNRTVLDIAWMQYRQQYGSHAYNGPIHKKFRHVAYRQVVRWVHGYLGKDIRVVIPSCVVSKIRAFFPPPGIEEDMLFQGFRAVMEE